MGEPGIFVSHVGCVVLSGMVPFVGWRRFNKENHSSKDGKFSCLADSEPGGWSRNLVGLARTLPVKATIMGSPVQTTTKTPKRISTHLCITVSKKLIFVETADAYCVFDQKEWIS